MTAAKIQKRQDRETAKFDIAKEIRALLDQAKKKWDSDIEEEIIDLVVDED